MLGNGFLPMFAGVGGAPANPWTGATWALSGGNAYNAPTLGSELLTDGGLENWSSSTNLTSWTETLNGTSTVNRESTIIQNGTYAARLDIDAIGNNASISQATTVPAQSWVTISFYLRTSGTGSGRIVCGSNGAGRTPGAAWTAYVDVIRTTGANPTLFAQRFGGTNISLYYDNLSAKSISLSTAVATVAGTSSTQTAAAKIATLTTGTQAGVVSLLDSASNPQNFLIAYHNGTSVLLDKCVAGQVVLQLDQRPLGAIHQL